MREGPNLLAHRCLFLDAHSFMLLAAIIGLPHKAYDRRVLSLRLRGGLQGSASLGEPCSVSVWESGEEVVEACASTTEAEGPMWLV